MAVVLWKLPRPARWVEPGVLAERTWIVETAQRYHFDPRLIASIVYVVQRDDSTPFDRQLERLVMGAWVANAANDLGFAEALDLSVGVAQIRPFTALAALVVYNSAGKVLDPNESLLGMAISVAPRGASYKQYRGLPDLDVRWHLPAGAVAALHPTFPVQEDVDLDPRAGTFDQRVRELLVGRPRGALHIVPCEASQTRCLTPWTARARAPFTWPRACTMGQQKPAEAYAGRLLALESTTASRC